MEAWLRAVQSREPRAPGKSGMLTAAIKQLTALTLWTLREAVSRTGALGYIEPVGLYYMCPSANAQWYGQRKTHGP